MKTQRIQPGIRLLRGASLLLLVLAVTAGGCGPKKSEVSGKVMYGDTPVTGGNIIFEPVSGGASVKGEIKYDATYKITGAAPGDYKVVVETESIKGIGKMMGGGPGTQPPPDMGKPPADKGGGVAAPPSMGDFNVKMPVYVEIPPKYNNKSTTPLTFTVTKGGQKKDFVLEK